MGETSRLRSYAASTTSGSMSVLRLAGGTVDYIAKMLDHLAKAEEANEKIAIWDAWAKARVIEAKGEDLHPEELLYYVSKELEKKAVYRKRVNNRSFHAMMAQTYGIAAMATQQVPHGLIRNMAPGTYS
jgi:hypothetical protein